MVKVIDEYLGLTFTDYLSMVKSEGRWVIVNKAFYVHPR
jgi:Putative lumazine-binding